MTIERRDAGIDAVLAADAEIRVVAEGFQFTEGPLWHPDGRFLLFSDIPDSTIWRWDEENGARPFRRPSDMANGLTYDRSGRLLACQHATSTVTRTEPDGAVVTIASHYKGQELNSPNDIVVRSDGAVYFSDPTYGRVEYYGVERPVPQPHRGVYRIDSSNALTLVCDDFVQPNGLCFSLDEKMLFVNDSERGHIRRFDVAPDGSIRGGEVFAELNAAGPGNPDGMKLDSAGNLYCAGPGGVHIMNHVGACLGIVRTPEVCANFAWGGTDLKTLFLAASTKLLAIEVEIAGRTAF